jgi:hypothetical protein
MEREIVEDCVSRGKIWIDSIYEAAKNTGSLYVCKKEADSFVDVVGMDFYEVKWRLKTYSDKAFKRRKEKLNKKAHKKWSGLF